MVLSCYKNDSLKRPFKSEKFLPLVRSNWEKTVEGCYMFRFIQRLKWLKIDLKNLNKEGFNSVEAEDLRLFHAFTDAQNKRHSNPRNVDLATAEKQASVAYKNAHAAYLSYLQQTAKLNWLEHGDENTRIFHQSIKQRRKQNKIHSIFNMNGDWVQSADEITRPWLDGYNSCFFKAAWPIIVNDLFLAISDFFKTGKILKEVNVTSISLIPKISVPSSTGDFRPITCCSIIYKCISKILCEKIGSVLPDVISQNQDLKKAYDTVEWGFIEEVIVDLGFPSHFVQLIMTCLTTTRYSILINGVPTDLIQPRRGLRQGDKESVQLLLSSFARFSSTTGLQVNPAKSSIYCCGGTVSLREELVSVSGFGKGVLPFRYLGVPISTKNLNAADCELLVEKMVTKIKIWSSRHLSFAGRAQLINSVLMSICSY
ncbi:uncharacterized protein [Spinacia oleracea]|uniref:Reverse transcriptase domain-containing protein n=1 Tax=Spinacia oleracea TaxID=3562 RepID=A0ABM3R8F3_SPIOL|nr:uncharacterized protein LOC130467414 [Spinacia oleracea]